MKVTKRILQKEATKKLIVETAYNIYKTKGFSATTSEIAKAASLSHGTIFAHFPTLNDLLIFLLEDFGDKLCSKLHEVSEGTINIEDILKNHLKVLSENEDFYYRIVTESYLLPEEITNVLIMIQSTVSFHFNKVIEPLIKSGNVKELPSYILFNTWIGLVHYYLQNRKLFCPKGSVLKVYGSELIDSFLKLIKN